MRLTFLFILTAISNLCAQSDISGKISQQGNEKIISNANVFLLKAKDSQLVKAEMTDAKGIYSFKSIEKGDYFILVQMIGYDKKYSPIFSHSNTAAVINISLSPKSKKLREVQIAGTKPLFEQRADKLVVNVSSSPVAMGGTAMEVLKKVPGVVIVQENVTLAGNKGVQIWIDGRPSPYQDMNVLLRDMPGDQIDKIELIRQPGAKYDAAGGAILNIVLKKNARKGFNGTVQNSLAGYSYNHSEINKPNNSYGRVNPSLSLNYRKDAWNIFGSSSYSQGTGFKVIEIERYIGANNFFSPSLTESNRNFWNVRIGSDFYASNQTTLGVLFTSFQSKNKSWVSNLTDMRDAASGALINSFFTDNISERKSGNYSGNFNIKHLFDTASEQGLNFDIDYVHYDLNEVDNFEIYPNTSNPVKSISQQLISQPVDIWVGKLDYTHPIDSLTKFELGIKSSYASINNDLRFYRGGTISVTESNQFHYKENIQAGYINFNKKMNHFEFNAGLRAEQTVARGSTGNVDVLNRNYLQWFPNASLLYNITRELGVQMAYSKRIYRPSFTEQNPFKRFVDSLTYQSGNTNLSPEIVHTGQIGLVYDGQPFIQAEYAITDDVIIENAPQLDGNKTFTTAQNLAKYYNWTFQANFPIKFKNFIEGYGGNQLINNRYKADYLGTVYEASRWNWLAYLDVNFNLPQDIKFEVSGYYLTKFLEEFITIGSLAGIDLGISKSFMDKRLKTTLSFSDVFYSQKVNGTIEYNDIRAVFQQRDFSRNLRLNLSYNFGNNKLKKQRNRNTGSEIESQRVKIDK